MAGNLPEKSVVLAATPGDGFSAKGQAKGMLAELIANKVERKLRQSRMQTEKEA